MDLESLPFPLVVVTLEGGHRNLGIPKAMTDVALNVETLATAAIEIEIDGVTVEAV